MEAKYKIGQTVFYKFRTDKTIKEYKIISIDPPASINVFTYELKKNHYASETCLNEYN
jgi:hypothetical protein